MNRLMRAAALTAVLLVVAGVGASTASATHTIAISRGTISSAGTLTFNGLATCAIALDATVPAGAGGLFGIRKLTAPPFGSITAARASSCTGTTGPVTFLLPGSLSFTAFLGLLPNITGVSMSATIGVMLQLPFGGNCLYGGTLSGILMSTTDVSFNSTSTLPRVSGSALCPTTLQTRGSLPITGGALRFILLNI